MLLITRRTIFLLIVLSTLWGAEQAWSYQPPQKQSDCGQRPGGCPPTPTPKRPRCGPGTGRKCPTPTPTPTPAILEERNPVLVPIAYNQDTRGKIDWRDNKTGAIKQTNGRFTLYNEYTFDVRKSDHLLLRLDPISYPWGIQLIEGTSKEPISIKQTKTPGEFQLDQRLPNDGRYRILV